ncbi:class I SAM-dependent methyltransferase [Geminicoccus roseus]|uniref:class I SAM-dependent methyltransferase n=1 Tax=Geminicoccus roseus TaxID=404900 RepID=UPI0004834ACB|nr:methyltransferase domain-containing protein [Geminicoccus roseus]
MINRLRRLLVRAGLAQPRPVVLPSRPDLPPNPENRDDLARKYLVEDPRAGDVPLLERRWYYSIEHAPGAWTAGMNYAPTAMTRKALAATAVEGRSCLDIGSMDGLVPLLLARRGAGRVVSYDRLDFGQKMAFLQDRLGVAFEYHSGMSLRAFRDRHVGSSPLDVVVFSGVLYHMFDPLGGLLLARSMVRDGGILIIETGATISVENAAYFNGGARFYEGDNFWLPSLANLDYLLRFARLAPLEVFHLNQTARTAKEPPICRVCVACRAVAAPPAAPGDNWINLPQQLDFAELIDWRVTAAAGSDEVPYTPVQADLPRGEAGTVDLYQTVRRQPEGPRTPVRLALADTW